MENWPVAMIEDSASQLSTSIITEGLISRRDVVTHSRWRQINSLARTQPSAIVPFSGGHNAFPKFTWGIEAADGAGRRAVVGLHM